VPVNWGILSTARINGLFLAGARQSPDVEIVAVASRDASRAESYARGQGIGRAHGSYEALLDDPEVEVVYIPLPNSMHVEWTVRALEAGKHVLCEKPLSRRSEDSRSSAAMAWTWCSRPRCASPTTWWPTSTPGSRSRPVTSSRS
jgi:xylose dehydrogenase (NAD/NADP)